MHKKFEVGEQVSWTHVSQGKVLSVSAVTGTVMKILEDDTLVCRRGYKGSGKKEYYVHPDNAYRKAGITAADMLRTIARKIQKMESNGVIE